MTQQKKVESFFFMNIKKNELNEKVNSDENTYSSFFTFVQICSIMIMQKKAKKIMVVSLMIAKNQFCMS